MTLMLGAWTVGLILSLLALGVFISFRVFKFADITTEGSITLGASVLAVSLLHGPAPGPRPACCTRASASTACSPGSSS